MGFELPEALGAVSPGVLSLFLGEFSRTDIYIRDLFFLNSAGIWKNTGGIGVSRVLGSPGYPMGWDGHRQGLAC